jgi:isopentenyl-diphosphate delta-isomerase type 1
VKRTILSYLLFLILPVIAFFAAWQIVTSVEVAVTISLAVAFINMILPALLFKRIPLLLLSNFVIHLVSGILGIILDDISIFMFAPACLALMIFIILLAGAVNTPLLQKMLKFYLGNEEINSKTVSVIRRVMVLVSPLLLFYAVGSGYIALISQNVLWLVVTAGTPLVVYLTWIVISAVYRAVYRGMLEKRYRDDEWFDVVNEKGHKIGRAPRALCHNGSKLLHPVVHIHIYNGNREILLQKRSADKDIQPGVWDTSVGGHIQSGEQLLDAVSREAAEEIGLTIDTKRLLPMKQYVFESSIERELVFSFIYFDNGPFTHQEDEIDELRFFDFDDVHELVSAAQTTPNFAMELKHLLESEYNLFK